MEIGMTKKKNMNNSSMICIDISIVSNSSIYKRLSLITKELKKNIAASVARTQYLQISGLKFFSLTLSQMS